MCVCARARVLLPSQELGDEIVKVTGGSDELGLGLGLGGSDGVDLEAFIAIATPRVLSMPDDLKAERVTLPSWCPHHIHARPTWGRVATCTQHGVHTSCPLAHPQQAFALCLCVHSSSATST